MCVCGSSLAGCSLKLAKNGSLAFTQKNQKTILIFIMNMNIIHMNIRRKLHGLELKFLYYELIIMNIYFEYEYNEEVA